MFEKKRFSADDIRTVFVFLATQALINLGELKDPMSGNFETDILKADVFYSLLNVLKKKTENNLSAEEELFLDELIENLRDLIARKSAK